MEKFKWVYARANNKYSIFLSNSIIKIFYYTII